jgi:hypothetical protein
MATFATGALLTSDSNTFFLIVNNAKQQFPDTATLNALTVGLAQQLKVVVPAAILAKINAGTPFVSVSAFVAKNPRIQNLITNAVKGIIPKTGLQTLDGGLATLVIAAAALYANAMADPTQWVNPVNNASKTNPVTQTVQKLITDTFNKLLNQALQQMGAPASDDSDADDAIDQTITDQNTGKDDKDDKEQDKEDVKEAGEKESDKEEDKDDKEEKEDEEKTEKEDQEKAETEKTDKEDQEKTEKEGQEKTDKEDQEKTETEKAETEKAEKEADKDGAKDGKEDKEGDDDDDDDEAAAKLKPLDQTKSPKAGALDEWRKIVE